MGPACIHSKFFPAMEGPNSKMSSTVKTKEFSVKVFCDTSGSHGFTVDQELLIDEIKNKALKKQRLGLYHRVTAVNGKHVSSLDEYMHSVEGMREFTITVAPLPSTIFMTDKPKVIKHKVNSFAFSGGQATKELQEELGANLEDDERLDRIGQAYASGKMMTAEIKQICIDEL